MLPRNVKIQELYPIHTIVKLQVLGLRLGVDFTFTLDNNHNHNNNDNNDNDNNNPYLLTYLLNPLVSIIQTLQTGCIYVGTFNCYLLPSATSCHSFVQTKQVIDELSLLKKFKIHSCIQAHINCERAL